MQIVTTERLLLRVLNMADAPFYLALLNDPSWLANIGDKGVRTLDDAREAIVTGPSLMQQQRGHSIYLVERLGDGVPIGLCGLIKRDTLPEVDIGYGLMPAYWGQGYAYEAAAAALVYGRDTLGLRSLMGITSPANLASNNLLQKLGLSFLHCGPLGEEQRLTNHYRIDFRAA